MQKAHRYTVRLQNHPNYQTMHEFPIKEHMYNNVMPDLSKPGTMVLNGRSSRIFGLAAINPLLSLIKDIHKAKFQATRVTVAHVDPDTIVYESESESRTAKTTFPRVWLSKPTRAESE